MSNRSSRRSANRNSQAATFAQRLKENLQKQAENLPNKNVELQPTQEPQITICKPDSQEVRPNFIKWQWKSAIFDDVEAFYYTKDTSSHKAGEYSVSLAGWDHGSTADMTPSETKELSQTFFSAYHWASVWQQHMGEFFLAEPTIEPVNDEEQEEQEADVINVEDDDDGLEIKEVPYSIKPTKETVAKKSQVNKAVAKKTVAKKAPAKKVAQNGSE